MPPESVMNKLPILTTVAVLSLLPALTGCPKRDHSGGSAADAAAARAPQELSGRSVQALAEDQNGNLLIGIAQSNVATDQGVVLVEGFGVYRLSKGASSSVQIAKGLPHATVRSIVVTPSGALIAATMNGIFRSENDATDWKPVGTAPAPTAYGLLQTRAGKLFAATNQGLLTSSDEGKTWAAVGENHGEVNVVIEHPTLGLFAGTDKGVIHSVDGNTPWEPVGLAKETVLSLVVDRKGELLAGTTASDVTASASNPGSAIMDDLIGWKGGVLRYAPPATALDAWPADDASRKKATGKAAPGKTPGKDRPVDAGTSAGGGGPPDGSDAAEDALEARWKPAGLQNSTIWAMAALPDGSLLAATHSRGLQRLDPATGTWSTTTGIEPDNPVAVLLVTGSGIYAGAVHGLFRSTDQGRNFQRATQE